MDHEPIRHVSLELAQDGVAELAHGRRAAFVARGAVRGLAVRHGFTAERPLATGIGAALALAAGGAVMWPALVGSVVMEKRYAITGGGLLLCIGVMFLWTLLHRSTYLEVTTERERRKLRLRGRFDAAELRGALGEAARRFGYDVDWSSLG
jgi:hypothetical protein